MDNIIFLVKDFVSTPRVPSSGILRPPELHGAARQTRPVLRSATKRRSSRRSAIHLVEGELWIVVDTTGPVQTVASVGSLLEEMRPSCGFLKGFSTM